MPTLRDKMIAQRGQLAEATNHAVATTDDQGTSYRTIFIPDKIPEGIQFWKCGVGEHYIDLIPWFSGNNHPLLKPDTFTFNLDLHVHQNIGASRDTWVCTQRTMKLPDLICDYLNKSNATAAARKLEWKRYGPKRRCVYLVWVHDTPDEENKGIQLWECAHWIFQNKIDSIAMMPKGGSSIVYSDPESGKLIRFIVKATGKYTTSDGREAESREYLGHTFFDRQEKIPNELLDMVFCVDDAIYWHPEPKQLAESFYGSEAPEEAGAVEGETRESTTAQEPPKRRFGAAAAPSQAAPPPEETRESVAAPAAAPPRRFGPKPSAPAPSNPAPAPSTLPHQQEDNPESQAGFVCNFGGTVGVDHEKLEQCKTCGSWDQCADYADSLTKSAPAPTSPVLKPRLKAPAAAPPVSKPTLTRRSA